MAEQIFTAAMIEDLVSLARAAGKAILAIYSASDPVGVELKDDESPLTAADLAAHQILVEGLQRILDLPILSEEGVLPDYAERSRWSRYWLIDPLDGTKEFLQRNGEFTVNLALIDQGASVFGIVHVPVQDVTYVGVNPTAQGIKAAFKYTGCESPKTLRTRRLTGAGNQPLTVLASHRHGTAALAELLSRIRERWPEEVVTINAGSSLKFCLIAEGRADFYPRLAPTSEWDTAAAQAVLEAAGGAVVEAEVKGDEVFQSLNYNSRASIINPSFYAFGDTRFEWSGILRR